MLADLLRRLHGSWLTSNAPPDYDDPADQSAAIESAVKAEASGDAPARLEGSVSSPSGNARFYKVAPGSLAAKALELARREGDAKRRARGSRVLERLNGGGGIRGNDRAWNAWRDGKPDVEAQARHQAEAPLGGLDTILPEIMRRKNGQ